MKPTPPFQDLTEEEFHTLPPIYQLIQQVPTRATHMATCDSRHSQQYMCEAPVKLLSRMLPKAPKGFAS